MISLSFIYTCNERIRYVFTVVVYEYAKGERQNAGELRKNFCVNRAQSENSEFHTRVYIYSAGEVKKERLSFEFNDIVLQFGINRYI